MQTLIASGKKHVAKFAILCSAVLALNSSFASTKIAPDLKLHTALTEHFRLHYPASHRRFTAYLSLYLEEAYRQLSRDLRWRPRGKIDVVVRSDTDLPNAFAQVIPYNRITIHAVPFYSHSFVGEYDNWIRTLAYHELTHVIANDTTSGFFGFLRLLMGSSAKMNPYQPQWLVEGLAVYLETLRSSHGRGRSHFADMHFRTAVGSGLLPGTEPMGEDGLNAEERELLRVTLDRLNEGPPLWPGGNAPYLYGYLMNEWIARLGGEGAPGEISFRSSGRVPFFIGGIAQRVAGQKYNEIWPAVVQQLKGEVEADFAAMSAIPFTPSEKLTDVGRLSGGPVLSSDQKSAYLVSDSYENGPGISQVDLRTRESRYLLRWRDGGGTRLRASPQGDLLFYSRFEQFREFRFFSDVFVWDLKNERETRVTTGLRAIDPDVSSDLVWDSENQRISRGSIVYVKNLFDGNQAIVRWDGENEKILFRGHRFERLSYPVFGKGTSKGWVFFSLKVNDGGERIAAINLEERILRSITPALGPEARRSESTPHVTSAGDLLFASSEGGISNIRRISNEAISVRLASSDSSYSQSVRITHVETGVAFPVENEGSTQIYAMKYGPKGYDLVRLTVGRYGDEDLIKKSVAEKIRGKTLTEVTANTVEIDFPDERKDRLTGESRSYSIFPAIWPQYWMPDFRLVPDGYQASLVTSGADAADWLRYRISYGDDSRSTFPILDARLTYDGFFPTLTLSSLQENRYLGVFEESNRVNEYQAQAMVPIRENWVGVGGSITESRFRNRRAESGGFTLRYFRSDLRSDPDSIEVKGERGYELDVRLLNSFAGDEKFSGIEAVAEQRIPSLIDRHFFRFVQSYGASNNEEISSNYYLGGGQETLTQRQPYLLRGYEAGSIFGRKIFTLNAEYWMPLVDLFRGPGTFPLFLERTKIRAFVDAGSAEFVWIDRRRMSQWPMSAGLHLLSDLTLFYRVPVTVGFGLDWGLRDDLGGQKQWVIGLYSRFL